MTHFDEIVRFIEEDTERAVFSMYKVQGMILSGERKTSLMTWTFDDGSYGSVHFRMSNAFNSDKSGSVPIYTFNGDGLNPNYSLCMSCDGNIFAVIDNDLAVKNHAKEVEKYERKGFKFIGYDIYKDWTDCVKIIYA